MRASYRGPRLGEMEEFPEQVISKPWAPKDEQDWPGEQWKNGPGREKRICEDGSEAEILFWLLYIEVLREHQSRLTPSIPLCLFSFHFI